MTNSEETLSVRFPSWGRATSVDQAVRQAETLCNVAQECIERSHRAVNAGETRLAAQLTQWANTCANAAGSTCNIQVREIREMETEENDAPLEPPSNEHGPTNHREKNTGARPDQQTTPRR